jgi:hypothetical protein
MRNIPLDATDNSQDTRHRALLTWIEGRTLAPETH